MVLRQKKKKKKEQDTKDHNRTSKRFVRTAALTCGQRLAISEEGEVLVLYLPALFGFLPCASVILILKMSIATISFFLDLRQSFGK